MARVGGALLGLKAHELGAQVDVLRALIHRLGGLAHRDLIEASEEIVVLLRRLLVLI